MGRPYQLVLFDLDGVLIDSRRVMELSWQAVRERFGIDIPFASYFALIGRPFVDIMDALGVGHLAQEIESVYMSTSLANFQHGLQFPGIDAMLASLSAHEIEVGIITSKDEVRTTKILRYFPTRFATVGTPERIKRGKPAPDALLRAMVEVGVDPRDTLFVGDMDVDQEAAARACVSYAHVRWGYGNPVGPCRMAEVPDDITSMGLDLHDER